jgi:hypothetical protein
MNRTVVAVLFPFLAVASGTIGVIWWDRGAPPGFNPTPHPTAIEALTREHRGVRIKGTAHYEVRLSQTMEGGEIFWIFPLMSQGDTLSREINVLIRTPRGPERMVTYEDLRIDGIVRPAGRVITPRIFDRFQDGGYDFSDGFVLIEPFNIEG